MTIYFLGPVRNIDQHGNRKINFLDITIINQSNDVIDILLQGSAKTKGTQKQIFEYLYNLPPGVDQNSTFTIKNQNVNYNSFNVQIASTSIISTTLKISIAGKDKTRNIIKYYDNDIRIIE